MQMQQQSRECESERNGKNSITKETHDVPALTRVAPLLAKYQGV